eukprot:s1846_g4.t1
MLAGVSLWKQLISKDEVTGSCIENLKVAESQGKTLESAHLREVWSVVSFSIAQCDSDVQTCIAELSCCLPCFRPLTAGKGRGRQVTS